MDEILKMSTVIRRREGDAKVVRTTRDGDTTKVQHALEGQTAHTTMSQRLRGAADRVAHVARGRQSVLHNVTLHAEQHDVFQDAADFIAAAADHLDQNADESFIYGRYIQPPRTGKTIIIAQIIGASGLTAVVLVPSQDLVRQIADELREKLPHIPVGVYYGAEKDLVSGGVIVATYQIVQQRCLAGELPVQIHQAALIFCDEAHRAMTDVRMNMLLTAFEVGALRIACTATPDWNDQRTLATYFPHLIHEITLQEAVELDLFARLFVHVLGMQVDGSVIRLVGGDLDAHVLGDIMSTDPFLEATKIIRYEISGNAEMPTLICCASRDQAVKVTQYLITNRKPDAAPPELILGNTPDKERREILRRYKAGEIDTLVNVGVLIEGWDSPRCKLLIDLAPTLSEVRAKQKYFRVMTKFNDAVARIYVLLPDNLERIPIFPQTLFGKSVEVEGYDDWIGTQKKKQVVPSKPNVAPKRPREVLELPTHPFDSVQPRLNPSHLGEVTQVILSAFPKMERLPNFARFSHKNFSHHLFDGNGAQLLRYCGVRRKYSSYARFMSRLFPDLAANTLLGKEGDLSRGELPSCDFDLRRVFEAQEDGRDVEWIFPHDDIDAEEIENAVDDHMAFEICMRLKASILTDRERLILDHRYPDSGVETTTLVLAKTLGVHSVTVLNNEQGALEKLKDRFPKEFPMEPNVLDVLDPDRRRFKRAEPVYGYKGKTVWLIHTQSGGLRASWDGYVWVIPKNTTFFNFNRCKTGELILTCVGETKWNGLYSFRDRVLTSGEEETED